MDETHQRPGLFSGCSIIVVVNRDFDIDQAVAVREKLQLHGADVQVIDQHDARVSLDGITHIISATSDFPSYESAGDGLIPVVRPVFVDHSLARNKLQQTRQYSPDPRYFMHDVVVCIADLPEGDADAIAGGVLAMGGQFTSKLTTTVTHIVALTMDNESCERATDVGLEVKVVLPHWFDDCLRLGRKIDEQPYLLPDPDILRNPNTKPPQGSLNASITGATTTTPSGEPDTGPTATRRDAITVFKGKMVMLSNDLGLGSHLRQTLEGIITRGGGQLAKSVKRTDMLVCKYREGHDYKTASRAGKDVGNLAWLYYLIAKDTWTSPLRRLLHYPVVRGGLKEFKDMKISLSNYAGDARTYLENLVFAIGAECTKTLKQDNTHLITAHNQSEKCAAAKDWGVHMVNHLWLEDSYAKWQMQSVTNPRYTHFPRRTNLGEVVGQTQHERAILDQYYADDDVEMKDYVDDVKPMQEKDGNARQGTHVSHQTPAPSKFVAVEKENITPSTMGSSRKSKDLATARLHSMTPDIQLYEKEKKRVGGVVYGGRRKSDDDRVQPQAARKRSIDEAEDTDTSEEVEVKKPRKGPAPAAMQLLISGYSKWVGHPKVEDNDRKRLRNMGIVVTTDPARATHLAAPQILRTHKFVTAMAFAPTILSTEFIDACLNDDSLQNPDEYLLQDKANEKKLGSTLKQSRDRARVNQNKLLGGKSVYVVENIHGGFDVFRSIVVANGGQCMLWRGRAGTSVREQADDDESSVDVYLLSPEDVDKKLAEKFRSMAEGSQKVPRIVKAEWLLESAMSQKIQPVEEYEVSI